MTVRNNAWFLNLLQEVRNEVRIEDNLREMQLSLKQLKQSQISELASNLPLEIIFECLNSSSNSQILLTCEILNILLSEMAPNLALERYIVPIERLLIHPQKEVKELALQEFMLAIPHILQSDLTNRSHTLMTSIINCFCDEEVSVGNKAIEFLSKFGQSPSGLMALCKEDIKNVLLSATGQNNIYKMRLFQVIIDIGASRPESLQVMKTHGLTEGLIDIAKSDDILFRLALLEELSKLAVTIEGYTFLQNENIIKVLVEQIKDCRDHTLATIVFPGLLKFFGNIAQKFPDLLIPAYPDIAQAVFEAVDSDEFVISITAMETVGFIGTSAKGKTLLCRQDEKCIKHILNKMNEASRLFPIEWRIRAVYAVANLMYIEDGMTNSDLVKTTEYWFNILTANDIGMFFQMAQQPFLDLKLAALQVFKEIAGQRWGLIKINSSADLMKFLLNRSIEIAVVGAQLKYDVVVKMAQAPFAAQVLGNEQFTKLQEFVAQGAFYVPPTYEIGFESHD